MKVSVVVITYNHEAYIEEALRSALGQQTSFEYEILVSEDASTDATGSIVESWRSRHPDRVRVLASERNLASNEVVARAFRVARGDYVALLDGDDYWTSDAKLETQARHLDEHPALSVCFHDAEVVDANGAVIRAHYVSHAEPLPTTLAGLWNGNPFATCTSMFRRASMPEIPSWYADFFPVTDWPLYVLFAERGEIGYLPRVMGAYRQHAAGLYSRRSAAEKLASVDAFYRRINECLGRRYDAAIRDAHRRYFYDWTREHARAGELELARQSFRIGRGYGAPFTFRAAVEAVKLLSMLYGPRATARTAAGAP